MNCSSADARHIMHLKALPTYSNYRHFSYLKLFIQLLKSTQKPHYDHSWDKPYDKNRFIALNAFRFFFFFPFFWLLQNSFTNSSLAINPMSKEESNILTDPCRPLGKWLTSLIPYWSLLGWVAATLQRRPACNGNSDLHNSQRVLTSKLFGFYYTTNKEITNQNYSNSLVAVTMNLYLNFASTLTLFCKFIHSKYAGTELCVECQLLKLHT